MPIKPLFIPDFFETDLARARRILNSWTSLKRLSSDDAEIIVRMIAQGIAEGRKYGLELAAECPTDRKNHLEALNDGPGAKSQL
jgi:hypothetical protein